MSGTSDATKPARPARRVKRRKIAMMTLTLLILASAALNWLAWCHARAMTHFTLAGFKTKPIESMTFKDRASVLLGGVNVPKPLNTRTPASLGLAFETVYFPGALGQQLEAWHIKQQYSRGVIAMFHGYASSKDSLLEPAAQFGSLSWDVLLVDFHGSGGSTGHTTSIGWFEADDVAAAFAWARSIAGDHPVVLYGASMGAAAVLRAVAVNEIKPAALILECPFDRMLTTVENRFHAMGVPAFPGAQLLVFWGGRQFGFDGFKNNPVDYAAAVRCPVLQMHGTKDPRVSKAEARRVYEALPQDAEWVEFAHAGHESYLATDPEKWRSSVIALLNRALP